MNELLFALLKIAVVVATVVITNYLVPWLKSNTALNENVILNDAVDTAVMYAEQTLTGGKIKKETVMDLLSRELSDKGIAITTEQIDALVEAAVFAMNQDK